jgi:hypothetical protein
MKGRSVSDPVDALSADCGRALVYGVSPLFIEIVAGINQQDTVSLLSSHAPEMTITPS